MAAAVLAVLAVLVVVTFLLLGLHLAQAHAETVRAQPAPGGHRASCVSPPDPPPPPGALSAQRCSPGGGRRHRGVPPPTQVLRMTIPRDGEGPPQRLSMSPRERTGTFAVKEGLNATAVVVFDYGKVRGSPTGMG